MSVIRPTTRGVAVLGAIGIVVVTAIVTGTPELAPLAVVIGVPLVVSPLLARQRAHRSIDAAEFHAHVEPATVEVGMTMQVKLSVTNRSPGSSVLPPLGLAPAERQWRARGATLHDTPRWTLMAPSVPSLFMLPRPGPGRTGFCLLDVPTGRRGVLELPSQRSWAHDPFGLCGASGPVTPDVLAAVHPVPIRPDQSIAAVPESVAGDESTSDPSAGSGLGELEGIRPYVVGDRLSLLHWPAKARYGTWFVRQFGAEGTAALSLVLDDRAGVHRRAEFERLISAALWMVLDVVNGHRIAHLETVAGRSYVFEPNDRGRAEARIVLAELQPVAQRSSTWVPLLPTGAVVLTTRTGAERLMARPTGSGSLDVTGERAGSIIPPSRIVVV